MKALLQPDSADPHSYFDADDGTSKWRKGDGVVFELRLWEGETMTVWHLAFTVDSTEATGEQCTAKMTISKGPDSEIVLYISPILPGRVQVSRNGKPVGDSKTRIPKRFLEEGIMASCDSNDPYVAARGVSALMSFLLMIQQDPALVPILYRIISPPPWWSVITGGLQICLNPELDKKTECPVALGGSNFEGRRFPISVSVNKTAALTSPRAMPMRIPPRMSAC